MRQNHPTAGFIPRAPPPAPLEAPILQKKDTYESKFLLRSIGSAQIDFSPTATGRVSSLLDSDPGVGDEGVDKENPLSLLIRAVWCRQGHVETSPTCGLVCSRIDPYKMVTCISNPLSVQHADVET